MAYVEPTIEVIELVTDDIMTESVSSSPSAGFGDGGEVED